MACLCQENIDFGVALEFTRRLVYWMDDAARRQKLGEISEKETEYFKNLIYKNIDMFKAIEVNAEDIINVFGKDIETCPENEREWLMTAKSANIKNNYENTEILEETGLNPDMIKKFCNN